MNEKFCMWGEVEYALMLSQFSDFQYSEGIYKGQYNSSLIASKLNEIYHEGKVVRTGTTLHKAFNRCRVKLNKSRNNSEQYNSQPIN